MNDEMSDSDDTSDFDDDRQDQLIRDFEVEGKMILSNLLPKKSSDRYEATYKDFMEWCKENKTNCMDENILLVYFNGLSSSIKPSTIWARWSMLRTTLLHRHNVDISLYQKLKSFLKNFSKGFKFKQAKTFSGTEVATFLETADDLHYLVTKVILIVGICGASRCCELVNLKVTDLQDDGNYFRVDIRDSKNDYPRSFVIHAPYYEKVKKYLLLRPDDMSTNRFFISYAKGKCHRQVIGKHKISEVPKTVALYLNLPNPELYTGHSLRRTSATLLSNSGASLVRIKNIGGWRSDAVAQRYIDNSAVTKKQNFDGIASSIVLPSSACMLAPTTSTVTSASIRNDTLRPTNVFKNTCPQQVSNLAHDGSSSGSVDRGSKPFIPFQNVENLKRVEFDKDPNIMNSTECSSHDKNDENLHSLRPSKKKENVKI